MPNNDDYAHEPGDPVIKSDTHAELLDKRIHLQMKLRPGIKDCKQCIEDATSHTSKQHFQEMLLDLEAQEKALSLEVAKLEERHAEQERNRKRHKNRGRDR